MTRSHDVKVDFTDPYSPHIIRHRRHCTNRDIAVGDTVIAGDDAGNTCTAEVRGISTRLIYLELNPDTFEYGDRR